MAETLFADLPPIGGAKPPANFIDAGFAPKMSETMDAATKGERDAMTAQAAPLAIGGAPAPAPAPVAQPDPKSGPQYPISGAPLPPPQAAPQQAQMPPPNMEQTQSTYTSGIKLSPELMAQQAHAIDATEQAKIAQNAVEAENARAQALIIQQKNDELAKQQQADQAEALRIKGEADKAQNHYLSAIDDYKTNNKVDPNKYWKDRGAGVGILAALAQGLGAFGSALTHTPNYAMNIINDAVNADIRAQEQAIAGKRDMVGLQGNLVQHFRQQGLDQESAARAAKTSIYDRALGKIDALTATSKNESLLARAGEIKAGIMAEKSNLANQNYLNAQGKFVKQTMSAPAQPMSVTDQMKVEGLKVYVPVADPKTGKDTGQYATYTASSEDDAKKIKQAMVVRDSIKTDLDRMATLVDTTWKGVPGTTGHRQVSALADQLRTKFAVLNNLGALSDKDYGIASQLGDPSSFLQRDSTTHELIGQFRNGIDDMVYAEMKGRGLFR